MASSNLRRGVAGVVTAGAVALGGLAVAAVNPLTSAGAQDASTTTVAPQPTTSAPAGTKDGSARSKVVSDALASLVADHTLTQDQADAVQARLEEAAKTARGTRATRRAARRQDLLATAASALGISTDDLRTELRDGSTVKQVAESHGVDVKQVSDALEAEVGRRIDEAVSAGRIDQERADALKTKATERIQDFVDHGGRRAGTGG